MRIISLEVESHINFKIIYFMEKIEFGFMENNGLKVAINAL